MNISEISNCFKNKRFLIASLGFFFGMGFGFFLKDILLWRRKEEGYLFEILKEIMNIKSEMKKIKTKIKKIDNIKKTFESIDGNQLERDEFEDAQSSLDEIESFYSFVDDLSVDIDLFIKEIDELLSDNSVENYNRCFDLCENESWKFKERGEFLWRYAMIAYKTTLIEQFDTETKHQRIFGAFNNALLAVKKSPKSSEAHKWLGVLYGVTGELSDTKKRILNGFKFKDHIDKCIELNPNDSYAYLLKGRFCYQVSNLAFYERKLAALLFETPPVATMDEAFECFQKCETLAPNKYGENHYFLSLCYQNAGDYVRSAAYLESAKLIPFVDSEIKIKVDNS